MEQQWPPTPPHRLAGVDEAGRGPLAGNVVAAAVILPATHSIDGLADSKKLSAARRESLYEQIIDQAVSVSIGQASVDEIDALNILHASMLAMQRAVDGLAAAPGHVLVDGNRLPDWQWPATALVKGDQRVACISAASIIAKVTRDRQMCVLDQQYPDYGFAQHMGYPTQAHRQALAQHGPCVAHRRSFGPVRAVLEAGVTADSLAAGRPID